MEMEDPLFKNKYQKYKNRVKNWEKDFTKKNNRIPSKYDIREANKDIRDAYKIYYKLKTSLLETTLSDVLSDDGFDILEYSQKEDELSLNSPSTSFQLPNDMSLLMNTFSNINASASKNNEISIGSNESCFNDENYVSKELQADFEDKNNPWNKRPSSNLNKIATKEQHNESSDFKTKLSSKLFNSAKGSFAKRNPRKALKKTSFSNKLENNPPSNIYENDALPDFETFLLQKAKEQKFISNEPILKLDKDITLAVDENWLNRLSNAPETSKSAILSNDVHIPNYGLSNLKVPANLSKAQGEQIFKLNSSDGIIENKYDVNSSDEIISNSEDDEKANKTRHVRKRRKILKDLHKNQQENNIDNDNMEKNIPIVQSNNSENILQITTILNNDVISKTIDNKISKKNVKETDSNEVIAKTKTIKKKKVTKSKETNIKVKSLSKTPKRITRSSNKKDLINDDQDDDELILENLKNRLILEQDEIILVPSANRTDLLNAETILTNYLNSNPVKKQAKMHAHINDKKTTAISRLEEKIKKGRLNENFVTIDVRKKVFVRGKKTVNYSKYKKKLWRHKKKINALTGPDMDMGGCDGGVFTCFTCGKPGHFAQQCKVKGDKLLPLDVNIVDDSPFPTLAEAEIAAKQKAMVVHSNNIEKLPQASNSYLLNKNQESDEDNAKNKNTEHENSDNEDSTFNINISKKIDNTIDTKPVYIGHKIPEDFLKKCGLLDVSNSDVEPIYSLNPDGSVMDVTEDVNDILKMFGHINFRKNQDKAIMRILSGLSTLVTLSTGSGKSLCYQLPAYIYSRQKKCITLVISPLVSLMEDQVHGVPSFLNAHCLHTNQTPRQRNKVMEMLNAGEVDILLISPEAVCAGERSTGFGALLKKLPPIAFACIDEVHCVSHWSHNFRPSYLMICEVLRKKLGVKTILGLTATATVQTRNSIIRHLGIEDGIQGIITDKPLPHNLILSISKDSNRDAALIRLLRSERFDTCQSIIIYCTRRDECERIASYIRSSMQDKIPDLNDNTGKKRKRTNWCAEPYHAGMPSSRRRTIQNAFMSNNLRIVVATVAFGMGINKSDIRAIIHFNMPRNFESYVQEVGRAGRDGKLSYCHTFLNSQKGNDLFELKRHIYANSIDRRVVRKLLENIFIQCSCNKNIENIEYTSTKARKRICLGHEIAFSIDQTVQTLDIPEENISTLLCYLELDENYDIKVLPNAYTMCKVLSYGGSKYLKAAAKECPPLAMAIALGLKNGTFDEEKNLIEFSVVKIASAIGWNSGVVKYQLKSLEWITVNGSSRRSTLSVNFYDLGFHIKAPGDFTSDEIDEALDLLYNRTNIQEKSQIFQLQNIYNGLSSFAHDNCLACCKKDYNSENSDKLKSIIRDYFEIDCKQETLILDEAQDQNATPDEQIIADICSLLNMYPENNFSGRSVARIFHGISSPNFPAVMWSKCKYWRAHSKSEFNKILNLSNNVIVRMRT